MENYYYISDSVYKAFPDLKVSEPFPSDSRGGVAYIAIVPDFEGLKNYYESNNEPLGFFAHEIVDSQVDLMYDAIEYDDDDNEIETVSFLDMEICKEWGLVEAIETQLGLSKERNIAYVIYKLADRYGMDPIQLANEIQKG